MFSGDQVRSEVMNRSASRIEYVLTSRISKS